MVAKADFEYDEGTGGADVRFSGRLTLARLNDLPARLEAIGPISTLDLSRIDRIDTVGAWIVTRTVNEHGAKVTGASEEAPSSLGDLRLLRGVRKFPQRVKCAILAWRALEQALHQPSGEASVSTETDG